MLALVVGTILAVGALAYVLFPLLVAPVPQRRDRRTYAPPAPPREQDDVVALREIEFDRATGKLSDADYDELRTRYTERALRTLRSERASESTEDAAEAAVLAYRARLRTCATCGPRPEPDAVYCSTCGTFLPGACASCGAAVVEPAAAYCSTCGHRLAA